MENIKGNVGVWLIIIFLSSLGVSNSQRLDTILSALNLSCLDTKLLPLILLFLAGDAFLASEVFLPPFSFPYLSQRAGSRLDLTLHEYQENTTNERFISLPSDFLKIFLKLMRGEKRGIWSPVNLPSIYLPFLGKV